MDSLDKFLLPFFIACVSVDYESGAILGVFDSRIKAEQVLKDYKGYADSKSIIEIKLNAIIDIGI